MLSRINGKPDYPDIPSIFPNPLPYMVKLAKKEAGMVRNPVQFQ
jgi:hypothetical protein